VGLSAGGVQTRESAVGGAHASFGWKTQTGAGDTRATESANFQGLPRGRMPQANFRIYI